MRKRQGNPEMDDEKIKWQEWAHNDKHTTTVPVTVLHTLRSFESRPILSYKTKSKTSERDRGVQFFEQWETGCGVEANYSTSVFHLCSISPVNLEIGNWLIAVVVVLTVSADRALIIHSWRATLLTYCTGLKSINKVGRDKVYFL